jgi:benzil reductase ((S)-benzoin forming)
MDFYLVTGTTKGIGAALRDVLIANPNNRVVTLSRTSAASGAQANVFVDFAAPETVDAAFQSVLPYLAAATWDRAVLINNAGVVTPVGPFDRIDAAALMSNLNVNVASPMLLTAAFARATRAHAARRLVINISSGAAKRPVPGWSAYCAAKAALEMATQVAAIEAPLNDDTLAVCSLAPGVVDTPMQGQIREKTPAEFPDVERFRAMKKDGALRSAHDVARDIVRLIEQNRFANAGSYDLRELT